jgi:hypothetical protein
MAIPFTQFLRPNGAQRQVTIDLDDETETMAQAILAKGFKFEIEELRNGMVSATVADPKEDRDVMFAKFVPNGPEVPEAIKTMIHKFHKERL